MSLRCQRRSRGHRAPGLGWWGRWRLVWGGGGERERDRENTSVRLFNTGNSNTKHSTIQQVSRTCYSGPCILRPTIKLEITGLKLKMVVTWRGMLILEIPSSDTHGWSKRNLENLLNGGVHLPRDHCIICYFTTSNVCILASSSRSIG